MSTLYLLKYNNYYNRIVKRETSLSGYQPYQVKFLGSDSDLNGNTAVIQNVNFIEGDYINTQQVINWGGDIPDYVVVQSETTAALTRWFVISSEKTRGGQLLLTLHRDLVADYYLNLTDVSTTIFVEKAIVGGFNDLIFNKENMSFNQIKTKETPLPDASNCPWLCIYAASKTAEGTTTTFDITTGVNIPISFIFNSESEFNNWIVKQAIDNKKVIVGGLPKLFSVDVMGYTINGSTITPRTYTVYDEGGTLIDTITTPNIYYHQMPELWTGSYVGTRVKQQWPAIRQALVNYYSRSEHADLIIYDNEAYESLSESKNQFVQVNTADGTKYYKISVTTSGLSPVQFTPTGFDGSIGSAVDPIYFDIFSRNSQDRVGFSYLYAIDNVKVPSLEDVTSSVITAKTFISANRFHLTDAPYDMFCMPYSDKLKIKNSLQTNFEGIISSKQLALDVAQSLISKYAGAGQVYDAQILPYCPLTSTIVSPDSDGITIMDLADSTGNSYTKIVGDNGIIAGYVLHASVSSFSRQISLQITIDNYKVESECDMYRLCSPNYNGIFEFNAAKNGGISNINIQCTYKPYTPYIKLYPTWGRLYGSNFSEDDFDARGLICGGDFSLPLVTSAWETYQLQNKNYQNSFDRQIQNLEVNNVVQREREAWSAASGALAAGVQGATSGGLAGGGVGAVIGGIFGAGASIAGGIRDMQLNDKIRQEVIDYTKDQFGYQLGNIKALPQSLSKVTAYNVDNKYFPFLEYYTCSSVEKQALKDKIKYNGMTIMAIGNMATYINSNTGPDPMYFKGQVIRIPSFDGDYHILNALAEEINKGVFI